MLAQILRGVHISSWFWLMNWVLVLSKNEMVSCTTIICLFTGYNDVPWHNDKILAPTMEKLAKEGIILESAYVQPFGTQSRAALTTGYYPIHTGRQVLFQMNINEWFQQLTDCSKDGASSTHLRSEDPAGLYTNFTLLPEWLSKMGYHTHMIGRWVVSHYTNTNNSLNLQWWYG